jgi:hypothetical protein
MHAAGEQSSHVLDISVDVVLARYTGEREIKLELPESRSEIKVRTVLNTLNIPPGMVGYIVTGGKLLEPDDFVAAPCAVQMFGIYDGG